MATASLPAVKYAEAFSLYCKSEKTPDLAEIAKKLGCHPETLVVHATKRNWAEKRGMILAQSKQLAAQERIEAAAKVDALAVREVAAQFERLATRLQQITEGVCSLPISDADPRVKAQQLAKGLELANETVRALAGLVETGRSLGLVLGPKNPGNSDAGRIDFSRLTTLSLTLIQAQKEAGQQPLVLDVDPAESVR